jgi:hypothetical protein
MYLLWASDMSLSMAAHDNTRLLAFVHQRPVVVQNLPFIQLAQRMDGIVVTTGSKVKKIWS